jgi:SulP family sulfate permease
MFKPKLISTLKGYTSQQLTQDVIAGLVVGVVALPLAIAFAIASGVGPEKGLITAIVAGFIISALGGSRVQIGGPTGAFVVIVYGIVQQYGYNGLLAATLMAGIILIIFGLAKLGSIIRFIPHSVITGFTTGIALIIFTGQISDFFGLGLKNLPADFVQKIEITASNLHLLNPFACALALGTIIIIWLSGKISRRIPGSLIALLILSALAYLLHLPVETIGTRFGALPTSLPAPTGLALDFKTIQGLINPAFTIAMLGAIESLLSAVVADGMIAGKHRSNTELIAQGVANIASPIFGGIPATGAIARTATNIRNGGRTPIAGIVHAVTLLLIMLFFGKLVVHIPLACLAGVLVTVAYHMSEWKSFVSLLRLSRGTALVASMTFLLTVFVDLTTAIQIGLILATFVFIRNMSVHTSISLVRQTEDESDEANTGYDDLERFQRSLPKGTIMYEIEGPLFFGAVYKFREALAEIGSSPRVCILHLEQVPVIDSTGVHALREALKALRRSGTQTILSGMRPHIREKLERGGILELISEDNLCADLPKTLTRAQELCA